MHRRNMLKGMAAVIALQPDFLSQLAANAATASGFSRVRPADPAWPNAESWAKLNEAAGGNLIAVDAPFAACATDPKSAPCVDALANIRNPFYIGDQPGGTQVSGWLDAWRPAPSAYAVKARSSSDVAAAVNFARDNRLRLVVKGAGHSYQGTSNAPDSLSIWTRAMNEVTLHDAFMPQAAKARRRLVPLSPPGPGPCGSTSTMPSPARVALCARRRLRRHRRRGIGSKRRLQQLFERFRDRRSGIAGGRDRNRGRRGADRERLYQSGPVLGAKGGRRWQLGRGHVWMSPADQGLFGVALIVGAVMSSALCAENLIRWP